MFTELLLLRLLHVLGGIAWVGSALFTTVFLLPALAASGASAAPVMAALRARRLLTFLPTVAILTIGSGLRLLWITSAGLSSAYFATPHGLAFGLAGASAFVAFVLGWLFIRPSAARSAQLGQAIARASDQERAPLLRELERARQRNARWSAIALVMLMIGASGMAVARYLG